MNSHHCMMGPDPDRRDAGKARWHHHPDSDKKNQKRERPRRGGVAFVEDKDSKARLRRRFVKTQPHAGEISGTKNPPEVEVTTELG